MVQELGLIHAVAKVVPAPAISGPRELVMRAMTLAGSEAEADRRIAYLLIDDAVELMLRTLLELPGHFTGAEPRARRALESADFSELLDAVWADRADRLIGLDAKEFELLHRGRHRLYHEGAGVDVSPDRLEVYLALAQLLFRRLFNEDMGLRPPGGPSVGMLFLERWADLEASSVSLGSSLEEGTPPPLTLGQLARGLVRVGIMSAAALAETDALRSLRHRYVHAGGTSIDPEAFARLEHLQAELLGRR